MALKFSKHLLKLKFVRFPRFPIAIEFTREGLLFVLLSLAIGGAAVNTGNNVLYLIFSIMLSLIVVSGIVSRRVLAVVKPRLEFPGHIFAGAPAVCFMTVENRSHWFPSLGVRLVAREPKFPYISRYFFYVRPRSVQTGLTHVTFPHRGEYFLNEMEVQTRIPFSFFVKIQRHFPDIRLGIYPRVYRFSEEIASRLIEGFQEDSPYRGESQQLLHLRDYNSLDASKRIHWKASAKVGRLLVKEHQKEQVLDLSLWFDCYATGEKDGPIMEAAISLFASFAVLFHQKGAVCTLVFPDRAFSTTSEAADLQPLFEYLAKMTGQPPEPATAALAQGQASNRLRVASRNLPGALPARIRFSDTLYIEDWKGLLTDQVAEVML